MKNVFPEVCLDIFPSPTSEIPIINFPQFWGEKADKSIKRIIRRSISPGDFAALYTLVFPDLKIVCIP